MARAPRSAYPRTSFSGVLAAFSARALIAAALLAAGCRSPAAHRENADEAAYEIIRKARESAVGRTDPFTIDRPADTLRRRLLLGQDLPRSTPASLGSRDVEPIEEWPDEEYFEPSEELPAPPWSGDGVLTLSLVDALQIGARNSREYQTRKELVYQAALGLDLERDRFRKTWLGVLSSGILSDQASPAETGLENSATLGVTERFKNGAMIAVNLGIDLVKLLTGSEDSSFGIFGDASISIPLLRGASKFVVTEPLRQAERNVVYAIYEFERFKREFSVQVATEYYSVLQLSVEERNEEENYRWLIGATRRARRMAEAQRLEEIQVDQTKQDELKARDAWIEAIRAHERGRDLFKQLLGIPVDADVLLDDGEMAALDAAAEIDVEPEPRQERVHADTPVELDRPSREGGGPLEMDPRDAVILALTNRYDLRVAIGRIYDAQRVVGVAADGLRADLTLFGGASYGERRTLSDAGLDDGDLRLDEGRYSAVALFDLGLERTAERNVYRNSLINFEQIVRNLQDLEDLIKLEVREDLRILREARERLRIQAESVQLAERRVASTSRFLEVDRAEARDVLEAQADLVEAKNALSAELVRYRIAELALQRDLGVLQVGEDGLWTEFEP